MKKKIQPPCFPFFPADLLSDSNVILMSLEELGAYILLMSTCWIEGSLPSDIKSLASLARMPEKRFQSSWKNRLSVCFVLDQKKNVFRHPRLTQELQKQRAFRKQKSEAGKASARKRSQLSNLKQLNRPTGVQRPLNSVLTKSNFSHSTSPSKPENKGMCSADVGGLQPFLNEVLVGLRTAYNVVSLRDEQLWVPQCEWAFENGYTAAEFLECFHLIRSQEWRTSRVTPRNVADNLPELNKLRSQTNRTSELESLPDLDELESRRSAARALPGAPQPGKITAECPFDGNPEMSELPEALGGSEGPTDRSGLPDAQKEIENLAAKSERANLQGAPYDQSTK